VNGSGGLGVAWRPHAQIGCEFASREGLPPFDPVEGTPLELPVSVDKKASDLAVQSTETKESSKQPSFDAFTRGRPRGLPYAEEQTTKNILTFLDNNYRVCTSYCGCLNFVALSDEGGEQNILPCLLLRFGCIARKRDRRDDSHAKTDLLN
jgi:hypothetical protein